jgi:hypothetical protein
VITSVEKWVYVLCPDTDHSMSKPQNHLMQFICHLEKCEKYLGITERNQTFQLIALINTNIFR